MIALIRVSEDSGWQLVFSLLNIRDFKRYGYENFLVWILVNNGLSVYLKLSLVKDEVKTISN